MSSIDEMRIWTSEKVGSKLHQFSVRAQEKGKDSLDWVVRKSEPLTYKGRKTRRIGRTAEDIITNLVQYSNLTEDELQERGQELRDYIQRQFDDIEDRVIRENDYEEITNPRKKAKKERKLREKIIAEVLPEAYSLAHQAIVLSELPSNKQGTITELTRAQIKGGVAMFDSIIDMKTGEGKTLTALMPAYLHSLIGDPVHISTVNEFLAFRDYQQAGKILGKLGLSVGVTMSDEAYMQSFAKEVAEDRVGIRTEVLAEIQKSDLQERFRKQLEAHELSAMNQYVKQQVLAEIPEASVEDKTALHNKYLNAVFNNRLEQKLVEVLEAETDQRLKVLVHEKNTGLKKIGYASDVTFGYHSEFAFDYLRDNTQSSRFEMVNPDQRFGFAIIDEVDNILIDAAQTPHILSSSAAKKYSDQQMHYVKGRVEEFMSEQRTAVASLEGKLVGLNATLVESTRELIQKYAAKEGIAEDSVVRRLRTEGAAVDLKAAIRKLNDAAGDEIGEGLYQLRNITKNSAVFDALFENFKPYFFRQANKEKKDRDKMLESLDYIIEGGSLNITEEGVEKIYGLGLQQTGTIAVNEAAVTKFLQAKGIDSPSPTTEDYISYLEAVAEEVEIANFGALLKKVYDSDVVDFEIAVDSPSNASMFELVTTFIRAIEFFKEGREYIVADGEVIVIDQSTHRPKPGTRYSNGIHEALECLHDVKIHPPSLPLGSISLPKFFQLYSGITGMSGSVLSVEKELQKTYGVETVAIAPNTPLQRIDEPIAVYGTAKAKKAAILQRVQQHYQQGRPVLLGVKSSAEAESYHQMFLESGFLEEDMSVLSAKTALEDGFEEAELVRQAGLDKRITIATNMAGRGTDIKLKGEVAVEKGLDVVLTYVPKSKRSRIQFIGRAGRLGDPGSSKVISSLEDEFFAHYQGSKSQRLNARLGSDEIEEDFCDNWFLERLYASRIDEIIEGHEAKAQSHREHTLKYDNIVDVMRRKFYDLRESVMEQSPNEILQSMRAGNYDVMVNYDASADENATGSEVILTSNFTFEGRTLALAQLDKSWAVINADLQELQKSTQLHGYAQQKPEMVFAQITHNLYRNLRDELGEHLIRGYK